MKIYLVSSRGFLSAVWQDPIYELETLIAHACDATIIAPRTREMFRVVSKTSGAVGQMARALVRRSVGKYEPARLPKKEGPEMAIGVGMAAWDLQAFDALGDYRKRFELLGAYVFDAWDDYPEFLACFNRVFIPLPEEVPRWNERLGVTPTLLPFGADALSDGIDDGEAEGSALAREKERPVDVVSYGRIPRDCLSALLGQFAAQKRLMVRIEGRLPEEHPSAPFEERPDRHYYASLRGLLRKAKVNLCFDTMSPGDRAFPHSLITLRWYEGFAAGCAAVGTRPTTPEMARLLPWKDAHIDMPTSPREAADFLLDLIDDRARLRQCRLRNYYYALSLHDWRWRIRDMFVALGVGLPVGLRRELERLQECAALARQRALAVGALDHAESVVLSMS